MFRFPMRSTSFVVALVVWAGLGLAQIGAAQPAARPTIQNVTLPAGSGLLIITGTGLGASPAVTVDGQPVAVLPGGSDTQLTVLAPAAVLTTPGTYRLTVTDTVRQVGDVFVIASYAGSVAAVIAVPGGTPSVAARGIAPSASGLAGSAVLNPLNSVGRLAVIEDSGAPYRTALGYQALASTTGNDNTATGWKALFSNTTGINNTAAGFEALGSNTTGWDNTAAGEQALRYNTIGRHNTASGWHALYSNTEGSFNTASGSEALLVNSTGNDNTASGEGALTSNTTGSGNTASGLGALQYNTTGGANTANGIGALYSNTTGFDNTAAGGSALYFNTMGSDNTALGRFAGLNATTGSYNVYLGAQVTGTAADTNTIRIGLPYDGAIGQNRTFIAGIYGTGLTGSVLPVFVDANGQLGTMTPGVISGTVTISPVSKLQQQVGDQQHQLHEQQTTIADLRARLARLEALLKPAVGRK